MKKYFINIKKTLFLNINIKKSFVSIQICCQTGVQIQLYSQKIHLT